MIATSDTRFILKRDISIQFLCKFLKIFKLYLNEPFDFRRTTTESAITRLLVTQP